MLTAERGQAAAEELQTWGQRAAARLDPAVGVAAEFDSDSNTYIVRLSKGPRVLIFRFSPGQIHTDGRESECERTLARKIKDLWNLI